MLDVGSSLLLSYWYGKLRVPLVRVWMGFGVCCHHSHLQFLQLHLIPGLGLLEVLLSIPDPVLWSEPGVSPHVPPTPKLSHQ